MSYYSASIFTNQKQANELNTSYLGSMEATRDAQNEIQKNHYSKTRADVAKKNTSSSKRINNWSWKKKQSECSKINLYPLLIDSPPEKLHDLALTLLTKLYQHQKFYQNSSYQNVPSIILDQILSIAKIQIKKFPNDPIYLEKLKFDDPKLQAIFYKMLKGKIYDDSRKKTGYPSLLGYFKIAPIEKTSKMICLEHTSIELLSLLFSKQLLDLIFQDLKVNNSYTITQKNLDEIVLRNPIYAMDPEIKKLLRFAHPKNAPLSKVTIQGKSKQKNIKINKTFYEN